MKKKKKVEEKDIKFYSTEIKRKQSSSEDYKKVISFVITLLVVMVCIGLLFFFNGKYVTKDMNEETTTTTTAKVEYDDTLIIASDVFKMEGTYYVLAYDSSDEVNGNYYRGLANVSLDDDTKVYALDLNLQMNKSYYNKKEKESISEEKLNFIKPTLIKVSKGKVKSYTTDKEEIGSILK